MPKPEKSKKDKTHGHHQKTIEDWTDKGWITLDIGEGESDSVHVEFDPTAEDMIVFGQVFNQQGQKLTGKHRPHVRVDEDEFGALVSLSKPATEDIVVLYKIVADDGGEEDDTEPVTI